MASTSDDEVFPSVEEKYSSEDSVDGVLRQFDLFGTTPPRTRILRRDRSWDQHKQRSKHSPSICKAINRGRRYFRNSLASNSSDTAGDPREHGGGRSGKRGKRSQQLLRDSERTMKLDLDEGPPNRAEPPSPLLKATLLHVPTLKVESANRFLSLSCKLVKTAISWRHSLPPGEGTFRSRTEFHRQLENIVKSGNTENLERRCKRQMSKEEEELWQTELKDMVWLELQAWQASRSVTAQDRHLCEARQAIPTLLNDILTYRFQPKPDSLSSDSGIHSLQDGDDLLASSCSGCLQMFCPSCFDQETAALAEVEQLLCRLEAAEALYPSSRAFGAHYPLYRSPSFTDRVKAMCLWYNIMKHHRLKILIIGRHLLSYVQATEGDNSPHSPSYSSLHRPDFKYKFDEIQESADLLKTLGRYYRRIGGGETRSHTYRKYLENVLKIRGLRKALFFLENVYLKVLRKGRIAMEQPSVLSEDGSEEARELRQFGCCSPEFSQLNLPSFRPAFLFLSRVPMDVIQEFLSLRLETKLEKPSSLSITQLIKELKEGLRLAVLYRERYLHNCSIALHGVSPDSTDTHTSYLNSFDQSLQAVFKVYLSYVEQWVALIQGQRLQKNILEEEWGFVTGVVPHIPGGDTLACTVFCEIAGWMLAAIRDYMRQTANYLALAQEDGNGLPLREMPRWQLLQYRDLQSFCLEARDRTMCVISLIKTLSKYVENDCVACSTSQPIPQSLEKLRGEILNFSEVIKEEISIIEDAMACISSTDLENVALQSRCREVLHQMYKFAFEYHKDIVRMSKTEGQLTLGVAAGAMVDIASRWLSFVRRHCEKGRGVRPRWSHYGLEFILCVSTPKFTSFLSNEQFEVFREDVESTIAHIMGDSDCAATSGACAGSSHSKSPSPGVGLFSRQSLSAFFESHSNNNLTTLEAEKCADYDNQPTKNYLNVAGSEGRVERVGRAIAALEERLEGRMRNEDLIGSVVASSVASQRPHLTLRSINFSWQRGMKIGQGRFGKVYTVVNNNSGEVLAMKEIVIPPNDARTIRSAAQELKLLEGIQHSHLIRYYGAEIRKDELLLFMELCSEGTLESLIAGTEGGLPETIVRRYTAQLVCAVSTLHSHSIVHRDIKPANIFLTSEGHSLKLGDFGSAVKIKAHTTVPGELKGLVGTLAYMAPEVFMRTNTVGHGRAVDIWSLGCVVIEMAAGKRPWSEYESNYQIMFKVGSGERPACPPALSHEGAHFLRLCLQHKPQNRASIFALKEHTFLKVDSEEDCHGQSAPSLLEDLLRLDIAR